MPEAAEGFTKPPWEHPYWQKRVVELQEFGLQRDFLVILAEVDQQMGGKLVTRILRAAAIIRKHCESYEEELAELRAEGLEDTLEAEAITFKPAELAGALMAKRERISSESPAGEAGTLFEWFMQAEEINWSDFEVEHEILEAFDPANRLYVPVWPSVDEADVIHDAQSFCDFFGKRFDLQQGSSAEG